MTRPSFFLVGNPRCGTTAIWSMLGQHPDVWLPAVKEPRWFSADLALPGGVLNGVQHPTSHDEYLELFAARPDGSTTGEATTWYLRSKEAARRIAAFQPDARIVAMFREPASFLRSLHLEQRRGSPPLEDEPSLERALDLAPARRLHGAVPRGCVVPELLQYADWLAYDTMLQRYLDHFPREQVLVLVHEDVLADPVGEVRRIFEHIGVDPSVPLEPMARNGSSEPRGRNAERLATTLNRLSTGRGVLGGGAAAVKRVLPGAVRRRALRSAHAALAGGAPAPLDPEVAERIRAVAGHHVEGLSEQIGRDLIAEWGMVPPGPVPPPHRAPEARATTLSA